MMRFFSLPRINDISTDLDNPPSFRTDSGKPCAGVPYPSSFAPKVRQGYPDLAPLLDDRPADVIFAKAVQVANSTDGWHVDHTDSDQHVLEATATTSLMRFKDDIVVRISSTEAGCRVDIRSRSRLGKHDFGANADRIRAFLGHLQAP